MNIMDNLAEALELHLTDKKNIYLLPEVIKVLGYYRDSLKKDDKVNSEYLFKVLYDGYSGYFETGYLFSIIINIDRLSFC